MRNKHFLRSMISLVLISSGIVMGRSETPLLHIQTPDSDVVYAQVSSVSLDPATIHKTEKPDATTVTVQIIIRGRVPPDSTARVSVGTYSTDPPGNNVTYDPAQVVQLKESPVVVKFRARVGPQTSAGKLIVAASINGTTSGVKVKTPEVPEDWHAALHILDN